MVCQVSSFLLTHHKIINNLNEINLGFSKNIVVRGSFKNSACMGGGLSFVKQYKLRLCSRCPGLGGGGLCYHCYPGGEGGRDHPE